MKLTVFQCFAIICYAALQTQAAPASAPSSTPCFNKQDQIDLEWYLSGEKFPYLYYPECEENGRLWEATQCLFGNRRWCFCVNQQTGQFIDGSEFVKTSEVSGSCTTLSADSLPHEGQCIAELEKFYNFIDENPSVVDSPMGYKPDCDDDGYFKAMQRNDNHFFCVDVTNGSIFEETRVTAGERPITENLCLLFPHSWEEFAEE